MAKRKVTDQDLSDALASGKSGRFTSKEGEQRCRDWVRDQQDNGRDLRSAENAIGLYVLNQLDARRRLLGGAAYKTLS